MKRDARFESRGMKAAAAVLALLVALLVPASLSAQDAPKDDATLRQWFDNLPPERRNQLRHRLRVFKRMDKEQQARVTEAVRAGKPIFSEKQRANVEKLRVMSELQRFRLAMLAREWQPLRRDERFNRALRERNVHMIHNVVRERRARDFIRTLPPEKRAELNNLPEGRRLAELTRLYEADVTHRRERLLEAFPGVKETREKARAGDAKARGELRRMLADLWALDVMLQRLRPEGRERMFEAMRNRTIEDAGRLLREEMRKQGQRNLRDRPSRDINPRRR